jgi:alkyl hydroperoxide reductase subunit AhpF
MSAHAAAPVPVRITVVESEACHFCADAQRAIAALAERYPVVVDTVDLRSPAGQELAARHRAPVSPLVLVDGDYFSSGRLPRRKLEKVLQGGIAAATGREMARG